MKWGRNKKLDEYKRDYIDYQLPPLFFELSKIDGLKIIKGSSCYKFRIKGCLRWQYILYLQPYHIPSIQNSYRKYVTVWEWKKDLKQKIFDLDSVLEDKSVSDDIKNILVFNLELFKNRIGSLNDKTIKC